MHSLNILVVVVALTGCSTVCDYALSENGWSPDPAPPPDLLAQQNLRLDWFRREDDEWLGCNRRAFRDVCDGFHYRSYQRMPSGELELREETLCIQ